MIAVYVNHVWHPGKVPTKLRLLKVLQLLDLSYNHLSGEKARESRYPSAAFFVVQQGVARFTFTTLPGIFSTLGGHRRLLFLIVWC